MGLAADEALLFGPRAPRRPCSSPPAGTLPHSPSRPPWRAVGPGLRPGLCVRRDTLGTALLWGWRFAGLAPAPAVEPSPHPRSEAQLC